VIDLEVLPELMNGIEVEKERKKRLLRWRVFSLAQKSRNLNWSSLVRFYLVLALPWPVAVCDVVCRRLVQVSPQNSNKTGLATESKQNRLLRSTHELNESTTSTSSALHLLRPGPL